MQGKIKKTPFLILTFLFLANLLAWIAVYDLSQYKFLEVNFFDIGQGDSVFVQTPTRQQILIDGGPGNKVLKKLAQEMPFWDRTLDLIVLSHPEYDHISGLIEVLKRYKVDYILWTGIIRDSSEFKQWSRAVEEENAQEVIAYDGKEAVLSKETFIKILHPFKSLKGQESEFTNNTSVVLKLSFNETSFLFTGDVYKSIEKQLLGKNINSDVLKVGHHGSKTSSAKEFLKEVSPQLAVISCGKDNYYGHPHQEVLENLKKYGIKILRTDQDGDIKIISDGYEVSNLQN